MSFVGVNNCEQYHWLLADFAASTRATTPSRAFFTNPATLPSFMSRIIPVRPASSIINLDLVYLRAWSWSIEGGTASHSGYVVLPRNSCVKRITELRQCRSTTRSRSPLPHACLRRTHCAVVMCSHSLFLIAFDPLDVQALQLICIADVY